MSLRDAILEYVNVDSFVSHFAEGLKESYVSQHGPDIPADIQQAIEASRVALANNRKWFEDALVARFPNVLKEGDLVDANALRKTELYGQVKKVLGVFQMDLVLTNWAAELASDWRDNTPELKATMEKLVGVLAPEPIPAPPDAPQAA
jgi:hypothetical protein